MFVKSGSKIRRTVSFNELANPFEMRKVHGYPFTSLAMAITSFIFETHLV